MNCRPVRGALLALLAVQLSAAGNTALGEPVPFPNVVPVGGYILNYYSGDGMVNEFLCQNYGSIGNYGTMTNQVPFGVIRNQPGGRVHNFGDLNNAGRIENWAKYPVLEPGESPRL